VGATGGKRRRRRWRRRRRRRGFGRREFDMHELFSGSYGDVRSSK